MLFLEMLGHVQITLPIMKSVILQLYNVIIIILDLALACCSPTWSKSQETSASAALITQLFHSMFCSYSLELLHREL